MYALDNSFTIYIYIYIYICIYSIYVIVSTYTWFHLPSPNVLKSCHISAPLGFRCFCRFSIDICVWLMHACRFFSTQYQVQLVTMDLLYIWFTFQRTNNLQKCCGVSNWFSFCCWCRGLTACPVWWSTWRSIFSTNVRCAYICLYFYNVITNMFCFKPFAPKWSIYV